jgi:hypothetical protein
MKRVSEIKLTGHALSIGLFTPHIDLLYLLLKILHLCR